MRGKYFQATALVNSGLLLMAVMGLLFPAVLHFTHTEIHEGKSEINLSRFSSCVMLLAYGSYLFFQLNSQANLYTNTSLDDDDEVLRTHDISSAVVSVYSEYIFQ